MTASSSAAAAGAVIVSCVVSCGPCGRDLLARGFARPLRHREREHARGIFAETRRGDLERDVSQLRRSAGASGFEHRGGERLDAERRQHGRAGKPRLRRRDWHKRACRPARKPRTVPRNRRTGGARARRASAAGPAGSAAATSTATLPSARTMREQAQVSARPKPAPKPRSRSSRSWAAAGKLAARRMICAAEVSPDVEPALGAGSRSSRRRRSPRRPHWPTGSASRRRSTAKPATHSSPAPRDADDATARALSPRSTCASELVG